MIKMQGVKLGLLADPAKPKLYKKEFFSLLDYDTTNSVFYLLGASERLVKRSDLQYMYKTIIQNTKVESELSFPIFSDRKSINSRIGLFPSSPFHLINGPGFIFAPYPANSKSQYLKMKAKLIPKIIKPIIRSRLIPVIYFPHGGKAANRTKADLSLSDEDFLKIVSKYHNQSGDSPWLYLEAGSGENPLPYPKIASFLRNRCSNTLTSSPIIATKTIYGGGISSLDSLRQILYPSTSVSIIPEVLIIGNISEYNLDMTIKLIEEIGNYNKKYF
ncbi:MAG: hypothetical protein INQ03_07335 [Candidatus Heimdallarchaeota archaeon]|nr:hypothetical protein [Candidatus Heimdallarchaeota archaeon]